MRAAAELPHPRSMWCKLDRMNSALSQANEKKQIAALMANAPSSSSPLLHVLFALQQNLQHISPDAVTEVAAQLDVPVSQVQAVVEFYSFFHQTARGRYQILFSNCTSCGHSAGDENLLRLLRQQLHLFADETRNDGRVSVSETSCIGMCDHGSSLLVNFIPLTGLDAAKIKLIATYINAEKPLSAWPEAWFSVQDNIRQQGLLLKNSIAVGEALRAGLALGEAGLLQEITAASLRGRGGAGFCVGKKWAQCRDTVAKVRYVVCNADEGEPGTFKDRVLLHTQADTVFEGMTLCAYAIGAQQGFLYLRGEYRYLLPHLQAILATRRKQNLLGSDILEKPGFIFDIEIIVGAGAYICGEESALLESMEGKRGIPRVRPPFPATQGYLGQPTVINNVETFFAAAHISLYGSARFKSAGTAESTGSRLVSISGDCDKPGVYEYPFGVSIRQILHDCGAHDTQAVQLSGAAGTLLDCTQFERTLSFEDLPSGGSFMVYGQRRDMLAIIHNFAHFFAHESCGFCTPCRVGSVLLKQGMNKLINGHGTRRDIEEMKQVGLLARQYSHCGLGKTLANPLLDGLKCFPQIFEQRLLSRDFEPQFDLDAALEEARQLAHRDDKAAHL